MNLPIAQAAPSITQWQAEIKAFARMQKNRLKKIILPLNCSNVTKLSLLKGVKQTLKIKLKQVNDQKQRLESEVPQQKYISGHEFKLVSEKDYLVISGKCLNEVDEHKTDIVKKMQELIDLKENTKNKIKTLLKSQCIKKSNTKVFEGFYIPEAKMTSSVMINPQGNTQINKSTVMSRKKDKKASVDKSLQLKSKIQMSQLYQNEMCSILEPIVQQAKSIFLKNKSLINTLKEGHKKQLELNLWLKQIKMTQSQTQFIQKMKIFQSKETSISFKKIESDTTGSPDEKDINVSDIKIAKSRSDSKKFQCQPRKNLLEQEKTFSIKRPNEDQVMKSKENENKSSIKEDELSPKQGRKKTQKINRPSGYSKNTSFKQDGDEEIYEISKLSQFADDNKIGTASNFKFEQEPSQIQVQEKIKMSKMMLNENFKQTSKHAHAQIFSNLPDSRQSQKIYDNSQLISNGGALHNSKNLSRIAEIKNVIHEEDEQKLQGSSGKSSDSEDQVFYVHVDKQYQQLIKAQTSKKQLAPGLKETAKQISGNLNHTRNIEVKNEEQNKSNSSNKMIQNQSKLFQQQHPFKKETNIFKTQATVTHKKSEIFFNADNKQNNSLSMNTNSSFNFNSNMQEKQLPKNIFQPQIFNVNPSPFDNIHKQPNQVNKNLFEMFVNPQKSNQNLMNQNSKNIFMNQDTVKITKNHNFNNFQQESSRCTTAFVPKSEKITFSQPQNALFNPFAAPKAPVNTFTNKISVQKQGLFQKDNTQKPSSIPSTPNIFGSKYKNEMKSSQIDTNLNIFGVPKGLKRESEYSDEQPVKQDEGMKMVKIERQEKEFFYY